MTLSLNSVMSVTATQEEGVFTLLCNITDMHGSTYDTEYCSRPGDTFGLNPTIQQWLSDNPDFPRNPFVPPPEPTIEEIRAAMKPLTARQFRLGLVRGGISTDTVTATIEAMPAGQERDEARIEWEYATSFNRTHPLIVTVSAALGLTPEQVDAMWAAAENL